MSLRARLLIVLTALTAAGLIAAGIATYAALRSFLVDRVDTSLAASERVLQESLEHRGPGEHGSLEQLASLTPGVYIQIRDDSGAILVSGAPIRNGGKSVFPSFPRRLHLSNPIPPSTSPLGRTRDPTTGFGSKGSRVEER